MCCWPPLHHAFLYKGLSAVVTKSLTPFPLRPRCHLWTIPKLCFGGLLEKLSESLLSRSPPVFMQKMVSSLFSHDLSTSTTCSNVFIHSFSQTDLNLRFFLFIPTIPIRGTKMCPNHYTSDKICPKHVRRETKQNSVLFMKCRTKICPNIKR